jgi:hypothetical protein
MVRRIILILLTSCLGTFVQAQTDFQVGFMPDTANAHIELGKPLWLELSTNQTTPSLNTIDFSELGKQFHLDKSLPINIDPKLGRQHWRLRLYAYGTGTKTIPPLLYAQARSTALNIEVKDAIDPKTNTPIKLQFMLAMIKTARPGSASKSWCAIRCSPTMPIVSFMLPTTHSLAWR